VPAYPGCPGKEAIKWVFVCLFVSGVGGVISGYQVNESWHLMAKGNPQWPQVCHYWLFVNCLLNVHPKMYLR